MKKSPPLAIGAVAKVYDRAPEVYLKTVADCNLHVCHLGGTADNLLFGPDRRERVRELKRTAQAMEIEISAVWIPYRGQSGTFFDGPRTLGLVPDATRAERMIRSCMTSQLAAELEVGVIAAHVGFVPAQDGDYYRRFIEDMRMFLEYCRNNGQTFIFETGQESVATIERMFKDLDMPNIGLNFDTGNLLIYNFDDPAVLVDRLGQYVVNTHIKDGRRPVQPATLGSEPAVGDGDAHVCELVKRLYREYNYTGPLVIEREIEGEQQRQDIERTVALLENIRKELGL